MPVKNSNTAPKKRKPYKHKFDVVKVQELAKDKKLTASDIAKHQGVAVSTITRYLESIDPQIQAVNKYSSQKADILCLSQLKHQSLIDMITSEWLANPEKYIYSQDVRLQKELIVALSGAKTYDHNQERLERGQSTSNISMLDVSKRLEMLKKEKDEILHKLGRLADIPSHNATP